MTKTIYLDCNATTPVDPRVLEQMLHTPGPVVVDAHVEPEENVYPMVAVGKSLLEMEMGGLS